MDPSPSTECLPPDLPAPSPPGTECLPSALAPPRPALQELCDGSLGKFVDFGRHILYEASGAPHLDFMALMLHVGVTKPSCIV